ncbi:IclR family transcriptional regulator [Enterovirga rhinocerotis]|uniref:IclR family transcriptional regulator n=1 Tax=Enterovirga rhinocerotis TaxID=1339210 RepID=A0A4R7BIL9_9HYPH|nr:IclR family transcriptional regulator [Enterovirga rhinocerotis]TDR85164.1 IclR family transcriptional regulator [Enterovirga rhinocerotis]
MRSAAEIGSSARPQDAPAASAAPAKPEVGNAVSKVCAVMRTIGARSPQRLSEIAASTGLNKVTALRILETLIAEGFVERTTGTRPGYARGREFLTLLASGSRSPDLRELAKPSLVRLADLSEDTALLSIRSGIESVCIDRQIGTFPIRASYLDLGSRRPLGVGAGAMALLAWLPEREIDAILTANAPRFSPYPRLSPGFIREEIAVSREQGYVFLLDRVIDKMGAIGVPLRDARDQIIGSLSIAALSERLLARREQLRDALLREQDLIRRELTTGHVAIIDERASG